MQRPRENQTESAVSARRFVVYALVDPRDGRIHYVGRSAEGSQRPKQHWQARAKPWLMGRALGAWLEDLDASGRGPYSVQFLSSGLRTVEDAIHHESWWIVHGLMSGWPLANKSKHGGQGRPTGSRNFERVRAHSGSEVAR